MTNIFEFLYDFFNVLVRLSSYLWDFITFDVSSIPFFELIVPIGTKLYEVIGFGVLVTILIGSLVSKLVRG